MHFSSLATALFMASTSEALTWTIDCASFPTPCTNDCFGIYVAQLADTATWNNPGKAFRNAQRKAAGCTPNPCCNGNVPKPAPDEGSCDEYPFAATVQGGAGAVLRCTDEDQNLNEGRAFGGFVTAAAGCNKQPNCQFGFAFSGAQNIGYCADEGGANDGFEWVKDGSGYEEFNKRELEDPMYISPNTTWKKFEHDPSMHFPLHLRREFELEDGRRVLAGTRDLTKDFTDEVFVVEKDGDWVGLKMRRELHGAEKSTPWQPPDIQRWL